MCQLSFFHGQQDLTKLVLYNLTLLNSANTNQDGFGFALLPTENSEHLHMWKTERSGKNTIADNDYLDYVNRILDEKEEVAIMSHVRASSMGQTVCVANSHPFRIGHLILAHNGSLTPKDDKHEIENTIDSYWFLHRLSEIVGEKKLNPNHIKEAMEDFTGKFALLVYDILQPNMLYIARGRTADLHYAQIKDEKDKSLMFLINTEKYTLQRLFAPHVYKLQTGKTVRISGITEFDKESVYAYDIDKRRISKYKGQIKEEFTKTTTTTVNNDNEWPYGRARSIPARKYVGTLFDGDKTVSIKKTNQLTTDDALDYVVENCIKMGISITHLSQICLAVTGLSLLELESSSIGFLVDLIISLKPTHERMAGNKMKLYKEILRKTRAKEQEHLDTTDVLGMNSLQIPWFLNTRKELNNVCSRL